MSLERETAVGAGDDCDQGFRSLLQPITNHRDYIKNSRIMQLDVGISCLAQIMETKSYTQNIHRHNLLPFSLP